MDLSEFSTYSNVVPRQFVDVTDYFGNLIVVSLKNLFNLLGPLGSRHTARPQSTVIYIKITIVHTKCHMRMPSLTSCAFCVYANPSITVDECVLTRIHQSGE